MVVADYGQRESVWKSSGKSFFMQGFKPYIIKQIDRKKRVKEKKDLKNK